LLCNFLPVDYRGVFLAHLKMYLNNKSDLLTHSTEEKKEKKIYISVNII